MYADLTVLFYPPHICILLCSSLSLSLVLLGACFALLFIIQTHVSLQQLNLLKPCDLFFYSTFFFFSSSLLLSFLHLCFSPSLCLSHSPHVKKQVQREFIEKCIKGKSVSQQEFWWEENGKSKTNRQTLLSFSLTHVSSMTIQLHWNHCNYASLTCTVYLSLSLCVSVRLCWIRDSSSFALSVQ